MHFMPLIWQNKAHYTNLDLGKRMELNQSRPVGMAKSYDLASAYHTPRYDEIIESKPVGHKKSNGQGFLC